MDNYLRSTKYWLSTMKVVETIVLIIIFKNVKKKCVNRKESSIKRKKWCTNISINAYLTNQENPRKKIVGS